MPSQPFEPNIVPGLVIPHAGSGPDCQNKEPFDQTLAGEAPMFGSPCLPQSSAAHLSR
jgi:hypothetical protein